MTKEQLTDQEIFDWLVYVFAFGEGWSLEYDKVYAHYATVRCVPVNRIVSVVEVSEYLKELADNSVTW